MLIALLNKSTVVTDPAQLKAIAAAVHYQLVHHASPEFERSKVRCAYYASEAHVPATAFPLVILDDADQAGALGYHDETPDGKPYGRIFAKTVLDNGGTILRGELSVSAVVSHEALEAFGDIHCNAWADAGTRSVAYELCDPVEADSYDVTLSDGTVVSLSNFVLPAWFDPQAPKGTKVDYLGLCPGPFQMTKGGYLIVMQDGKTGQVFGDAVPKFKMAARDFPAARTARRLDNNPIDFDPEEADVPDPQPTETTDQPEPAPEGGVKATVTTPRMPAVEVVEEAPE